LFQCICRLYTRAFWGDREFLLVDTGGLMSDAEKLPKEQQVGFKIIYMSIV